MHPDEQYDNEEFDAYKYISKMFDDKYSTKTKTNVEKITLEIDEIEQNADQSIEAVESTIATLDLLINKHKDDAAKLLEVAEGIETAKLLLLKELVEHHKTKDGINDAKKLYA